MGQRLSGVSAGQPRASEHVQGSERVECKIRSTQGVSFSVGAWEKDYCQITVNGDSAKHSARTNHQAQLEKVILFSDLNSGQLNQRNIVGAPKQCRLSPRQQAGHLSQSDGKALLLKTTPTQLSEHGEVELVSSWSLHPCMLASLVQDSTLHTSK